MVDEKLSPEVEREIESEAWAFYRAWCGGMARSDIEDALRAQRLAGRADPSAHEPCLQTFLEERAYLNAANTEIASLRAQVETLTREVRDREIENKGQAIERNAAEAREKAALEQKEQAETQCEAVSRDCIRLQEELRAALAEVERLKLIYKLRNEEAYESDKRAEKAEADLARLREAVQSIVDAETPLLSQPLLRRGQEALRAELATASEKIEK